MVEEGTWAYLEITHSTMFAEPLPQNIVASAFVNRELYLVLANYGQAAVELGTSDPYISIAGVLDGAARHWKLGGRSLHRLRRAV